MRSAATDSLFSDIIGHEHTLNLLKRLGEKRETPHALLFSGPRAVGKRRVARRLAAQLLAGPTGRELEKVELRLVLSGTHPDLHLIDLALDKRDIPVEDIRTLRVALNLKPYYNRARIGIIDNAHRMTIAASNALLKTLEEPGEETFLLLISDSPHRLPSTILSRCQQVEFAELSPLYIGQVLERVFSETAISKETITELSGLAQTSLSFLGLEQLVNPNTLEIEDRKNLVSHVEDLLTEVENIRGHLRPVFQNETAPGSQSRAIQLATEYGAKRENSSIFWMVLKAMIRQQLRNSTPRSRRSWPELLLEALDCERLVAERNANAQLQLSSLFLHLR